MSDESRKRAQILLFSSLVLTAVIAAGLSNVTFRPGLPIPEFESGQVVIPYQDQAPVGMGIGRFAAILMLIALGVIVLVIIIRAARGIPWKRLLAGLWSLFWKLALGAGLVLLVFALLPHTSGSAEAEPPLPPPRPLATAPLGPVPPGLIWAAGIVLGAVVVLVCLRLLFARSREPAAPWVQELALARRALGEGGDPREVIVRCYTRMAEALQAERGIERQQSMTTGEFEALLVGKGLPGKPVHQLTRLFEAARYGRRPPAVDDERGAVTCLDAILDYCRSSRLIEAA